MRSAEQRRAREEPCIWSAETISGDGEGRALVVIGHSEGTAKSPANARVGAARRRRLGRARVGAAARCRNRRRPVARPGLGAGARVRCSPPATGGARFQSGTCNRGGIIDRRDVLTDYRVGLDRGASFALSRSPVEARAPCVRDVHETKSRRPGLCHRLRKGDLRAPPHRALKPQPQFRAPRWVDSSPAGWFIVPLHFPRQGHARARRRDHDVVIGTGLWKPQPQPESRGRGGAAAAPFAAFLTEIKRARRAVSSVIETRDA
jgi:hypothetical protein